LEWKLESGLLQKVIVVHRNLTETRFRSEQEDFRPWAVRLSNAIRQNYIDGFRHHPMRKKSLPILRFHCVLNTA
jgi:hypothetical protein